MDGLYLMFKNLLRVAKEKLLDENGADKALTKMSDVIELLDEMSKIKERFKTIKDE